MELPKFSNLAGGGGGVVKVRNFGCSKFVLQKVFKVQKFGNLTNNFLHLPFFQRGHWKHPYFVLHFPLNIKIKIGALLTISKLTLVCVFFYFVRKMVIKPTNSILLYGISPRCLFISTSHGPVLHLCLDML